MAWPIVIATNGIGIPVTEVPDGQRGGVPYEIATNGFGTPVVFVASGGMPVTGVGGWKPSDLGSLLVDLWDAEDESRLALSGTAVNSWTSLKNGYAAAQAISASKPIYTPSGFNGRPGLIFDGADDELTFGGVGLLPTGANPAEIWLLFDQAAPASDGAIRSFFGYGDGLTTGDRRARRTVVGGVSRGNIFVSGAQATGSTIDLQGRNVLRATVGAASTTISINGATPESVNIVPATGAARTRIGATPGSSASQFMQGVLAFVGVTASLNIEQSAQMLNYLKTRGGIA